MTPTIFGSTVSYPSDSLASCCLIDTAAHNDYCSYAPVKCSYSLTHSLTWMSRTDKLTARRTDRQLAVAAEIASQKHKGPNIMQLCCRSLLLFVLNNKYSTTYLAGIFGDTTADSCRIPVLAAYKKRFSDTLLRTLPSFW